MHNNHTWSVFTAVILFYSTLLWMCAALIALVDWGLLLTQRHCIAITITLFLYLQAQLVPAAPLQVLGSSLLPDF